MGKIRPEQIEYLVEWVCSSNKNRRTPCWKIPVRLHWDVSEFVIRYALKNQGFHRYIARRKPPELTVTTMIQWAEAHLDQGPVVSYFLHRMRPG